MPVPNLLKWINVKLADGNFSNYTCISSKVKKLQIVSDLQAIRDNNVYVTYCLIKCGILVFKRVFHWFLQRFCACPFTNAIYLNMTQLLAPKSLYYVWKKLGEDECVWIWTSTFLKYKLRFWVHQRSVIIFSSKANCARDSNLYKCTANLSKI